MSRGVFALIALLSVGCTCQDKNAPTGEPATTASGVPRVQFSAQPWLRGGPVGAGNREPSAAPADSTANPDRARASVAGYDLHETAKKGCSDEKCTGGNCGKLCTQWMDDTIKTFSSAAVKNDIYFNCFGACLAGRRDR